MSKAAQASMFDSASEDDGLVIIGVPRDTPAPQSHSTFRKIDMAAKQGKYVSFSWGDLMVMLPRDLYEQVLAFATRADQESRAAAITAILEAGLQCSE